MRTLVLLAALALAACAPPATQENVEAAPSAETATTADDLATVDTPLANARVTSPLTVTGTAPANWYFENQFPVRLVDAQDRELVMAPATPRVNWTENTLPKQFDATLTFSVTTETQATLVLQEDMPGEDETPREVRIPVTLVPAS